MKTKKNAAKGDDLEAIISQGAASIKETSKPPKKGGRPRKEPTKRVPFSLSKSLAETISTYGGGNMSFFAAQVFSDYFDKKEAGTIIDMIQVPFTSGKVSKVTLYFYLLVPLADKIDENCGNRSAFGEGVFRSYFAEKGINPEGK